MSADTAGPAVRVERVVAASPDLVFEAWTRPEVLKLWWGPRGVTAVAAEMDVRPGGRYAVTMQPDAGQPFVLSGEYREVVPSRRLVKTWEYHGDTVTDPVESIVTVEFIGEGASTRLILTQEFLEEPRDREGRDRGWRSSLDRLDAYFTSMQR